MSHSRALIDQQWIKKEKHVSKLLKNYSKTSNWFLVFSAAFQKVELNSSNIDAVFSVDIVLYSIRGAMGKFFRLLFLNIWFSLFLIREGPFFRKNIFKKKLVQNLNFRFKGFHGLHDEIKWQNVKTPFFDRVQTSLPNLTS